MRLLLVEDHHALRDMLAAHLRACGFLADAAGRGDAAIALLAAGAYDAVVLDLGLPDRDGLEVLAHLRGVAQCAVPVLVLTARDGIGDRVGGLDAGADDYLLKPFDLDEFDARLRALLRRGRLHDLHPAQPRLLRLGDLVLDAEAREARVGGATLDLTRRELSLLEELMRAGGRTVVRDALEERLWGLGETAHGNALEAAVSRLRRRLAHGGSAASLETIRGIGYRLAAS